MIIGVPKEIKDNEYRVSMTPNCTYEAIKNGHTVYIENNAGLEIGFTNENYIQAGAKIINTAAEIFDKAEMIIKVKEPQPIECKMLKPGQILFTYLHLASSLELTKSIIDSKCIAISYETVTNKENKLPLLIPMSEIAGRLSIQFGATFLEKVNGGKGVLLGGVPGVKPATVVILGGGVVGLNATKMAVGLNADVYLFDNNLQVLRKVDEIFGGRVKTIFSDIGSIEKIITIADLIIGAVLIPGAISPKLITKKMLKLMTPGTVIVDVAIDQGGCFETSKPTTHSDPTYVVDDVIHYCVANMPGAVARTATKSLTNATIPYILELANYGWEKAISNDPYLMKGLNICKGKIVYKEIAESFGLDHIDFCDL